MARVLAYTSPGAGHLFPLTPILDELAGRGHQIAVRTLAVQVPLMQARGFAAAPISGQVESIQADDWRAGNPRQALKRSVRCFCARAVHDAPDLQRAIVEERPDVLLVDINSWAPWPLPRRGADRGPPYVRTPFRCVRPTRRRLAPGCHQRWDRWGGCATVACDR